jgi:hypothetical protein
MATVFNRFWRFWKGTNRSGMVHLTGSILIGAAGAVTSYDFPGATVTLVNGKTGRYRIQLIDQNGSSAATPAQPTNASGTAVTPWGIQDISPTYISPTADNAVSVTAGSGFLVRNFTPLSGYFDLQCVRSDTLADANPESGGQILLGFAVKLSSVTP